MDGVGGVDLQAEDRSPGWTRSPTASSSTPSSVERYIAPGVRELAAREARAGQRGRRRPPVHRRPHPWRDRRDRSPQRRQAVGPHLRARRSLRPDRRSAARPRMRGIERRRRRRPPRLPYPERGRHDHHGSGRPDSESRRSPRFQASRLAALDRGGLGRLQRLVRSAAQRLFERSRRGSAARSRSAAHSTTSMSAGGRCRPEVAQRGPAGLGAGGVDREAAREQLEERRTPRL